MKFRFIEEFNKYEDLVDHFDRHVTGKVKDPEHKGKYHSLFPAGRYTHNETGREDYENDADAFQSLERYAYPSLSYQDDNSIELVGYERNDGKYALYKRDPSARDGETVVYSDDNPSDRVTAGHKVIITYYLIDDIEWEGLVRNTGHKGFYKEFDHNILNTSHSIEDTSDAINNFRSGIDNRIQSREDKQKAKEAKLEAEKQKELKAKEEAEEAASRRRDNYSKNQARFNANRKAKNMKHEEDVKNWHEKQNARELEKPNFEDNGDSEILV